MKMWMQFNVMPRTVQDARDRDVQVTRPRHSNKVHVTYLIAFYW